MNQHLKETGKIKDIAIGLQSDESFFEEMIFQAHEKIKALTVNDWQLIANQLQTDPDYKKYQTKKNLHKILRLLDIKDFQDTSVVAQAFLSYLNFPCFQRNILYALSSKELKHFKLLLNIMEIKLKVEGFSKTEWQMIAKEMKSPKYNLQKDDFVQNLGIFLNILGFTSFTEDQLFYTYFTELILNQQNFSQNPNAYEKLSKLCSGN